MIYLKPRKHYRTSKELYPANFLLFLYVYLNVTSKYKPYLAVGLHVRPNFFYNLTKSYPLSLKIWIRVPKTIYYKSQEPELQKNVLNGSKCIFEP